MKINCVKLECQCDKTGLAQLFLNKEGVIRYVRIRHFSHKDTSTLKPQFTYCRIEDLESLKDLLKTQSISLTTEKAIDGQVDQDKNDDPV